MGLKTVRLAPWTRAAGDLGGNESAPQQWCLYAAYQAATPRTRSRANPDFPTCQASRALILYARVDMSAAMLSSGIASGRMVAFRMLQFFMVLAGAVAVFIQATVVHSLWEAYLLCVEQP